MAIAGLAMGKTSATIQWQNSNKNLVKGSRLTREMDSAPEMVEKRTWPRIRNTSVVRQCTGLARALGPMRRGIIGEVRPEGPVWSSVGGKWVGPLGDWPPGGGQCEVTGGKGSSVLVCGSLQCPWNHEATSSTTGSTIGVTRSAKRDYILDQLLLESREWWLAEGCTGLVFGWLGGQSNAVYSGIKVERKRVGGRECD